MNLAPVTSNTYSAASKVLRFNLCSTSTARKARCLRSVVQLGRIGILTLRCEREHFSLVALVDIFLPADQHSLPIKVDAESVALIGQIGWDAARGPV